jgi:hypothetical protein
MCALENDKEIKFHGHGFQTETALKAMLKRNRCLLTDLVENRSEWLCFPIYAGTHAPNNLKVRSLPRLA